MVAGHLQIKKDYYYMVLNLKGEDGQAESQVAGNWHPGPRKKEPEGGGGHAAGNPSQL